MFTHYLTIARRNLLKHRGYSLINIVGLAVGLACCVIILLYVQDELSYDRHHPHADRTYRIVNGTNAKTPPPLVTSLQENFPEIESFVRLRPSIGTWLMEHEETIFVETQVFWADPSLFEVFDFQLIQGNPETALVSASQNVPTTVIINETTAKKFFGDEDPMGKVIRADDNWDLTVTGVYKDLPPQTHIMADYVLSLPPPQVHFGWNAFYTYIVISEGARADDLEQKFQAVANSYVPERFKTQGIVMDPILQPVSDIHLYSHLEGEAGPNSDIIYVYILCSIAVFILLIACINFMNLATARSSGRAHEVGMRKVVGADRRQIMAQFLGESVLITFVSLLLAVVLIWVAIRELHDLTGKDLTFALANWWYWAGLLAITAVVGVISGSYPAVFLSAFRPVDTLKESIRAGTANAVVRKLLVVMQFAVSIILIIGTGIVSDQMAYVQDKRLGMDQEHIVVIPATFNAIQQQYVPFKNELLQNPAIIGVTRTNAMPGRIRGGVNLPMYRFGEKEWEMESLWVGGDFITTFGLELIAGRGFPEGVIWNDMKVNKGEHILNETAVARMGFASPDEALGKHLEFSNTWPVRAQIIGVVKDFHLKSLHETIAPLVIDLGGPNHMAVRIQPEGMTGTIAFITDTWKKIYPDFPISYSFMDDDIDQSYRSEMQMNQLFRVFSVVAVLVACLGLLGLASFTAEQRTREIGVRKVLGASVANIVRMLSGEFVWLVLAANLIAWPLAYYVMNLWLTNFAYRIEIGSGTFFDTFLVGSLLALVIALITVGYQALKAAWTNPVDTLRYE